MARQRRPFGGHDPWQSTRQWVQGCAWSISRGWPGQKVSKVCSIEMKCLGAYVEHLNVVKDVVVVRKVVAWDDIDAGILLDLPVLETEPLTLGEEVISGQLAAPVGFVGLFEVTQPSHARETQK